ncbi:MAG: hypothetical protein LUC34_02045 [Campylobacter sp.]|nr:hypothetical protein [Campylobacter sp.]
MQAKTTDIAFFDIEVNVNSKQIESLGVVIDDFYDVTTSVGEVISHFKAYNPKFICGHNFIEHDRLYLSKTSFNPIFRDVRIIDTLYLSMLLYPNKKLTN